MPRIRPSLKIDLSSIEQEPKVHSRKNTQDWMRSNMATILEAKKILPKIRMSNNHEPPSYERVKDAGFGFDTKGWHVSNTFEDVFIHVSRNEGKLKGEYDGDKIHISVSYDNLKGAYNSIAPILYSNDSPFDKWKVTDNSKCSVGSRVSDGAQFTLYAKPDKDDSTYSAEYLKSV
ncbi:type III effector, partial [Vibrio cholerae]|nr:type III effector [Vibrio cholerae]